MRQEALVRVSLGKIKYTTFDPTAALPATGKGRPEMGNNKAKLAWEEALTMERLQ
jgi:hypothetical protein